MKVLVFLALATVVLSQNSMAFHGEMKRSEIVEEIVKRCGSGQVALQKRSTDELVEILKRCGDGLVIEKREEKEDIVDLETRGGRRTFFRSFEEKKKLAELEEREWLPWRRGNG